MTPAALLALALQCSPTIHPDTVHDIARTESGLNPYAIGIVGQNGIFPKNIDEAISHVERLEAENKNYSIGLMQINQSNFKKYNVTANQLFDACKNLAVSEKILTDCYQRGGTLKRALSCYYSGNFNTGQRPEKSFNNTSYIQRIGYVVPSTQSAKVQEPTTPQKKNQIVWPTSVVKGNPNASHQTLSNITYPTRVIRGDFVITENKENIQ
ncbi:lytic transglycosylase domain-containing protein [Providencia vermicola]|uniref:lytic transglycosylase domain-containing protein n=1 Tax=Providencia vermicola TaxID=333965 RepID=UPI0032DA404D